MEQEKELERLKAIEDEHGVLGKNKVDNERLIGQ